MALKAPGSPHQKRPRLTGNKVCALARGGEFMAQTSHWRKGRTNQALLGKLSEKEGCLCVMLCRIDGV
jgi:hypothetical protein